MSKNPNKNPNNKHKNLNVNIQKSKSPNNLEKPEVVESCDDGECSNDVPENVCFMSIELKTFMGVDMSRFVCSDCGGARQAFVELKDDILDNEEAFESLCDNFLFENEPETEGDFAGMYLCYPFWYAFLEMECGVEIINPFHYYISEKIKNKMKERFDEEYGDNWSEPYD